MNSRKCNLQPIFDGLYFISDDGGLYSTRSGKFLRPDKDRYGYLYYVISIDGKRMTLKAHRLVAEAFIPNPENKPTVNHRNGIRDDNRVSNLEWATVKEQAHGFYRPREESARMYAPYYRQAAMKVYALEEAEREPYLSLAYEDVSAAFAWYLENENQGRPIILAGFSQGADMCYRLLEEYFGDEALQERLVAVYAIGWPCTEERRRLIRRSGPRPPRTMWVSSSALTARLRSSRRRSSTPPDSAPIPSIP